MNRQQLLRRVACLCLVLYLLAGCGGMSAESTSVPTPVPPTPTSTPIPPTATPTPVPPTRTATPTPSATATSTTSTTDYYRFMLGDMQCVCLFDGVYRYPLKDKFAGVALEEVREALRQHNLPTDKARSPYTFLYVNTGQHQVLVDMGSGRSVPTAGKLVWNMEKAGIEPGQIDTVIITHAHPDHIGGLLDGDGRPVFPSASYYISEDEWNFWFSEDSLEQTPKWFVRLARESLGAVEERVNLLEGEAEIVPGIRALPAPGHTPGHLVVAVTSGDELLLYISDTATHILHLEHPQWRSSYDILPGEAAASNRQVFDLAADEKALVVGTHFDPFPSLGTVVKVGEGWQWRPVGAAAGRGQ